MQSYRRVAITFGEQTEMRSTTETFGNGLAPHGFNLDDLGQLKLKFNKLGGEGILETFHHILDAKDQKKLEAGILVLKLGVNVLMGDKHYADKVCVHQESACVC